MRHLILAFLLLSSLHLKCQEARLYGTISGEDGPLPFASIALNKDTKGTVTDVNGQFTMRVTQGQSYDLVISYLGYLPYSKSITIDQDTVELDVQLTPMPAQMEAIVVTGNMKSTFVSESPIKIDVIGSQQLETYLPSAGSSLVENIQLVNGVQEVVACGVCYTNSISINGLPGPYTAVLMDGTPMYGNLASVYGLNGIPNMIIDRFEVIKGPSSTLYGSEAVAGVINIITKDPATQPLLSIDLMGTSHLESFNNITLAPTIGNSHGFIGINHAYVNNFDDVNKDGFGDGVNLDRMSIFTKWNINRKSGKDFQIAGKYYFEDRRNGVEAFLEDRNYREIRGSDSIYGESIYTKRGEVFGSYTFNSSLDLKIDFSLSHHDQDSYYGSDNYLAQQSIAFANLLWRTPIKQHDLLIGLTSRYNAYDDNSPATEEIKDGEVVNHPDHQFIPGVFVQDELTINDKWTVLGGLRLDHYTSHGFILAPRLNLKYSPSAWTTFRTNFGTGFRVVNLFTEDHAFVTGQREVDILESLDPEESYNLSLNINQIYAALGGSGTIDIEGYWTHFTNKIIPDYDTPGKIIYQNSEGYARTMGLGLNVSHSFAFPLQVELGFNLQEAIETETTTAGNTQRRHIEYAPQWSGLFNASYIYRPWKLSIAYTMRITGPMSLPEVFDLDANGEPLMTSRPTTSETFSLHNLQVQKDFSETFSLYAGLQNLTNFIQTTSPLIGFNDPNAPVGFSDYFDTSYAYAPNHGREFYLGLRWQLGRKNQSK